jgi:hypothetical protein
LIKLESASDAEGIISIQFAGNQTNTNQITFITMGVPVKAGIKKNHLKHYKFLISYNETVTINFKTVHGKIRYELTSSKINDEEFGTEDNKKRKSKLIASGHNNDPFIFKKNHKKFKVGKMYYLTVKSVSQNARTVIRVSHETHYSQITDSTPLKVDLRANNTLLYYIVDPTYAETNVLIEAIPSDKKQFFNVYYKVVSIYIRNNSYLIL